MPDTGSVKRQHNIYCPICGEFNPGRETFRCPECKMDLICPSHRHNWLMVCSECTEFIMTESFQRTLDKTTSETPPGMVLVSPGKFIMGSNEGEPNCSPQHIRHTLGYFIDEHPVTNSEFKKFKAGHVIKPGYENEPVTGVTWIEARSYTEWAGKRLPTESEWEKAMRGVDGNMYPWGDEIPDDIGHSIEEFNTQISRLSKSHFGAYDGVGGIQEWVEDWYMPYPNSHHDEPAFGKSHKVLRGGNWAPFQPLSVCDRQFALPDERVVTAGFRCVKDTSIPLDYDITQEREQEQSRIKALVEQLEMEKSAKKIASDENKIILHDRRIAELEDAIEKVKQESRAQATKKNEPTTSRKFQYVLSAYWESLIKISGSKQDVAIRYAQILVVILIIYMLFANILARERVVFSVIHDDDNYIAVSDSNAQSYRILEDLGVGWSPHISPDGKNIVFVSDRDETVDIWLASISGNLIRKLSNSSDTVSKPRFTKDGRIVWFSYRDGNNSLYISDITGSDIKLEPLPSGEFGEYDVSPDGKYIVFCLKVRDIWRIYVKSSNDMEIITDTESNSRNPVFTPNGKRILFSTDRFGNYELAYMEPDGSDFQRLTYSLGDEIGGCSFSSNGRWIFTNFLEHGFQSKEKQIVKMRWNGTARKLFDIEHVQSGAISGLWGFKRLISRIAFPSYKAKPPSFKNQMANDKGVDILIEAHTRWFKTGITVRQNDLIMFSSEGLWRNLAVSGVASDWVSTQGYTDSYSNRSILPESPIGKLIGRIGNSEPFPIGLKQSFISDRDGELRVMMNSPGTLSMNDGIVTLNTKISSNHEITVKKPLVFETLKYFGLDDEFRFGSPPESITGRMRINLIFLSMRDMLNPQDKIQEKIEKGRAILLEPSSLYNFKPAQLDKFLSDFRKSFDDRPLPKFAFYLPSDLSEYNESSMSEIVRALRKHFPGYPIISDIKTEEVLTSKFIISNANQFDCLIIDFPPQINSNNQTSPLSALPTMLESPLDRVRNLLPTMPLLVSLPIESRPNFADFTPEQIELMFNYYNSVPKVVGIVLQGREVNQDIQPTLSAFSRQIVERVFPIDIQKRSLTKQDPILVGKAPINGKHKVSNELRGLSVNRSGDIFTSDRGNAVALKFSPQGEILAKTNYYLPDQTVLDRLSGVYVDRNDRVIVFDEFPGFVAYFDDSLEFADLKKLPGEEPGGVAGITGIVRDNQNNFFTISDAGKLLQKFDRDFNLIKWTGGTSYRPGYFIKPTDIAIGPRQSIYVLDQTKPYIQKFTPELEFEMKVILPMKDTFFNPIPLFITIDDAGSIYIVEKRTRNVYRYSPAAELVSFFQLPDVPEGGIVITSDGIFRTIINKHIFSYDLKQQTPPPE